jgi:hypothetical protein
MMRKLISISLEFFFMPSFSVFSIIRATVLFSICYYIDGFYCLLSFIAAYMIFDGIKEYLFRRYKITSQCAFRTVID